MRRDLIFFIPAKFYIRVVGNMEIIVESFHFGKWEIGCHYDLYIFQLIHFCKQVFGLVLAMVALRAEIHDQRFVVLFEVAVREIGCAVNFQYMKSRNGGRLLWLWLVSSLLRKGIYGDCK